MDCRECSSEMTALLDGELPPSLADQVRTHIDSCFPCAEELAALRKAADLVHAHHRRLETHPAAWNALADRLGSIGAASRFGWLALPFARWRPAMAIALTGFGMIMGLWSYQRHIESRRALEDYMTRYMQIRAAQEQSHRQQARQRTGGTLTFSDSERSGNPFLLVHQTTQVNPFRR